MQRLLLLMQSVSRWLRQRGEMLLHFHAHFVAWHPKFTLGTIGVITAIAIVGMLRLTVRNNYEADLPATDETVRNNKEAKEVGGDVQEATLMLVCDSGDILTPERLAIVKALEEDARDLPGCIRIAGLGATPTIRGARENGEWVITKAPLLEKIPDTPETLRDFQEHVVRNKSFYGKGGIVADDFTAVGVIVETEGGYAIQRDFNEAIRALKKKYHRDGMRLLATGDLILNEETDTGIERQVRLLSVVSLLVTIIVIYLASRSMMIGVAFPLLLIILADIWTMGIIGWSGLPLNVVTSAIPVLLAAISASYMARMMTAWDIAALDQTRNAREISIVATRDAGEDIVKSAVTGAFGSITLLTFLVAAIRQFGIFFAAGCVAAMLLSMTLLPACRVLFAVPTRRRTAHVVSIGMRCIPIGRFAMTHPAVVFAIAGGVLLYAIAGMTQLRVGVSWREFFPNNHEVIATADTMNEKFGYSYYFTIMVDTGEEGGIKNPAILYATDTIFNDAKRMRPDIGGTRFPGDAIRQVNREYFHEGDTTYDRIPETREVVSDALLACSLATSPGDLSGAIDYEERRMKCRILLTSHDIEDVKKTADVIRALAAQHYPPSVRVAFGGPAMRWVAQTKHVVEGKIENAITAVITVCFLGIIIFRSIRYGFFSVVPLLIATATTFGTMGWCGIRLNMGTAIVTSMAVSFGVDAAFHFLHFYTASMPHAPNPVEARMSYAFLRGSRSIVVDTTANAAGFLVFLISDFGPVRNLGWLVPLNLIISMMAIPTIVAIDTIFYKWSNRRTKK